MTIKDTADLDKSQTYKATVLDHPEYGIWILSHDGEEWNADKTNGGSCLACCHYWEVEI